jgi:hypothetical protein
VIPPGVGGVAYYRRMTATAAPPTPSGVYWAKFPVSAKLPGSNTPVHKLSAMLADTGLYLYRQVPVNRGADGKVFFYAPVNYAGLPQPGPTIKNGYVVPLADGDAVWLTGGGGCGCGNPLKRWAPQWAAIQLSWPA